MYLQVFLNALVGGLVSTLPIGPINLTLISYAFGNDRKRWWAVTTGVILADFVICIAGLLISIQTAEALGTEHWILVHREIFLMLVGFVTLGMGVAMMRSKSSTSQIGENKLSSKRGRLALMVSAGLTTALVPTLIVFWVSWWLHGLPHPEGSISGLFILTFLGVVIGDLCIFLLYRAVARKLRTRLRGNAIQKIEHVLGAVVVAIGLFCAGSALIQLLNL